MRRIPRPLAPPQRARRGFVPSVMCWHHPPLSISIIATCPVAASISRSSSCGGTYHSIIRSRQLTAAAPREQCPLYGERAACAVGTWTDGITTATACVTCPPGTFYPPDIADTTCTLCPPGTFNDVRAKGEGPQCAVQANDNTPSNFSRS